MRLLKSIQSDLNQFPELGKDLSIVNGVLLAEKLNDFNEMGDLELAFVKNSLLTNDKAKDVLNSYISPDDMDLFTICESTDDAIDTITSFYKVYHSLRYVNEHAVIRLNKSISDEQIKQLNQSFSDILIEGDIQSSKPFLEEVTSKDELKKFRIAFKFNKINFGRLVSMVRMINSF